MIWRVMAVLRCRECVVDAKRTDRALASVNHHAGRIFSRSLDSINASLDPGIEPYTSQQIGEAIAYVQRRRRLRTALEKSGQAITDLAEEALRTGDLS